MPRLVAGRAAKPLQCYGAGTTHFDAAGASSLVALDNVVTGSARERCDLGIAAGVHICQKPGFWLAFQTIGLCPVPVFAAPLLECGRIADGRGNRRRGVEAALRCPTGRDRIYASIRAWGGQRWAWHAVMTPRLEGSNPGSPRAYEEAGIDPPKGTLVEVTRYATVGW